MKKKNFLDFELQPIDQKETICKNLKLIFGDDI